MGSHMVAIARYSDVDLAHHHFKMLERRGFMAELREPSVDDLIQGMDEDGLLLLVVEEQVEAAEKFLDAVETLPMAEPSSERDTLILVGAVLGMIGLLLGFGPFEVMEQDAAFFPYFLSLLGGTLFMGGLIAERGNA